MTDVGLVIIGGGVIGMACAARLARSGLSPLLLERNARFGEETSSRNSGVIHAGIYYEPGSLKALTCVEGLKRLYARCERDAIPHRRCGKLIVATNEDERAQLDTLLARGMRNGAGALQIIEGAALARLEPRIRADAALWSPETGIVDPYELLRSYLREALDHGAELVRGARVDRVEPNGSSFELTVVSGAGERSSINAERVINAAGLDADRIAQSAGLPIDTLGYRLRLCKGDYFTLSPGRKGLCQHLVYPVPVHAGLGIHLTLDLEGGLRAGPDAEYVATPSYVVDPSKASAFAAGLRRFLPDLRDDELSPAYAGIRPKLQGPGEPARDFVIEHASRHGIPGLFNLIGIESPGLTASEAIAERVAQLVV